MASPAKLAQFLEAVRESNLLKPADLLAFVVSATAPDVDAEAVARDLVARGLLTSFQARLLWKGKGTELFLNQYVLMDKLGEGGMGEVFRARHTRMERIVALKIMRRERMANPEAVKRFRREIKASASLAHENVVMAYDADQSGDVHFFAMEFVDGTTLDRLVRDKGPLPVSVASDYVRQTALGLQHAHEKGLIHRDIKPGNLLLDSSGVVKISDLGLVLIDDPEDSVGRITREGLTVGTPDFVSPEQARNPRGADIRADIYSLGCTFYFLLTGEVPFPGGTPTEKMLRHSRESVPEPERSDLSEELKAILWKMTVRKPDQRYQTPEDVALALEPFIIRKQAAVSTMKMPAYVEEGVTEDALPTIRRESDSRFTLPSNRSEPKTSKKGCLSVLLTVGSFSVVGIWMGIRWLISI